MEIAWRSSAIVRTTGQDCPNAVPIIDITCKQSATVRTLGQHHPDAALVKKACRMLWKAGCTEDRPDGLSLLPDAA
jgi:hypothetical protein